MKIERKGMVITGVPLLESITVAGDVTIIQITGGPPLAYERAGLTKLHSAIGEALSAMPSPPASESSKPRVWNAGDTEPEGVIAVIDCDDDRWVKVSGGWEWSGNLYSWRRLLNDLGPLTEDK